MVALRFNKDIDIECHLLPWVLRAKSVSSKYWKSCSCFLTARLFCLPTCQVGYKVQIISHIIHQRQFLQKSLVYTALLSTVHSRIEMFHFKLRSAQASYPLLDYVLAALYVPCAQFLTKFDLKLVQSFTIIHQWQ